MIGWCRSFSNQFPDETVRFIVILTLLVLNNPALRIEPRLIDYSKEISHAIRFHPQGKFDCVRRNVLEELRPVAIRPPVDACRANLLHHLEKRALVAAAFQMFASGEHQMLKKMGETSL